MRVIVINGYPGAGKDTFCEMCKKYYEPTYQIWTSTPAKRIFEDMGWDGQKTPEIRKAMSEFMNMSERLFDYPYNYTIDEVRKIVEKDPEALIFIHCREPLNIIRYVNDLSAMTVLVTKNVVPDNLNNESDKGIENYQYDYIVFNIGTLDDLESEAMTFVRRFMKEVESV